MTSPLYLVDRGTLDGAAPGGELRLGGEEGRHAATVRRTRAGEEVDVADGAGLVARCVVEEADRQGLVLQVRRLDRVPPRLPRLVLVQALAKGGRDELAVETATEFGVDAVVPWQSARSVAVWQGDRAERGRRRWEGTVRAAAKQSRRATVPIVEPLVSGPGLGARCAAPGPPPGRLTLVLHETAAQPLAAVLGSGPRAGADGHAGRAPSVGADRSGGAPGPVGDLGEVVLVVGPEGGITDEELSALGAAGGRPVRLGPEVLRTSSAGPAALAVLSVLLGRWR